MKNYQYYLNKTIHSEWSSYYIDYALLKQKLSSFYSRRKKLRKLQVLTAEEFHLLIRESCDVLGEEVDAANENESDCNCAPTDATSYFQYVDVLTKTTLVDRADALFRLSVLERKEFSFYLDLEASNAGKFYIENLLVNIRKLIEEKNCDQASVELLNTLAFCCTNIITFRQLLIRYDAFRRTFDGMPLTEWFIQQSIFGRSHPVHALFTLDGLKDMENIIIGQMHEKGLSSTDFTSQIEQFLHLLEKTNRSMEKAVAGHLVWKDRILMSLRQYFLFGFQSRGIMNEPKIFMSMRGRHFKKEIAKIEKWRAKGEFLPDSNEDEVDHTSLSQKIKLLKPENRFPLFLNLLSCFLFMMNNYIIEPSSAYYAEALGSSDALSGERELKWTFHKVHHCFID